MARGDFTLFEEFANQLGSENHDFEVGQDVIKLGIIDDTSGEPSAAQATPTWATYVGDEVTDTGGYTANGITLANQSFDEVAGVATFDADNITIAQDPAGFINAQWGILYNDTNGTDMAIGYLDIGGGVDVSERAGQVAINWHASGILTVTIT